jgi:hypothetical protein
MGMAERNSLRSAVREAAALAVGEAMGATSRVVDEAGVSGWLSHFSFLRFEVRGYVHPRAMRIVLKTKELQEKQFVRL